MPSFRQRPLTWLFWIATACVDMVAVFHDFERPWVSALVMGQMYVAGGWLALGRSHRLARAGVFTAAVLALASRDFYLGNRAGEWHFVLGTLITGGVVTALLTWIFGAVRRTWERPAESSALWQISIVEILGWMIIVAVASTAVRHAHFGHVVESSLLRIVILVYATTASLVMTAFLPSNRPISPLLVGAAGCAIVAIVTVLRQYVPMASVSNQILSLAFVSLWVLVQRLDENSALRPDEPESNYPGMRIEPAPTD